jgi:hypothetical protein
MRRSRIGERVVAYEIRVEQARAGEVHVVRTRG